MKKAVSFRLDPDLLENARRIAARDNRSLTNFIETLVKDQVERAMTDDAAPVQPFQPTTHCSKDRMIKL